MEVSQFTDATIRVDRRATRTTMTLRGEFDHFAVERFGAELSAIQNSPPRVLDVDMARVTFASSALVRMLGDLRRAVTANGGELAIVDPSPIVSRVLTLCGLDELFPHRRGESPALASSVGESRAS